MLVRAGPWGGGRARAKVSMQKLVANALFLFASFADVSPVLRRGIVRLPFVLVASERGSSGGVASRWPVLGAVACSRRS